MRRYHVVRWVPRYDNRDAYTGMDGKTVHECDTVEMAIANAHTYTANECTGEYDGVSFSVEDRELNKTLWRS